VRDERISATEPVSALRHIRIVETGEELVDFLALCPDLLLDRPRFRYKRETLLRQTVAAKLCEAEGRLPEGYRFLIVEGWRPPHIQRRMYRAVWNMIAPRHPGKSGAALTRIVNRYSAPMNDRVPPPHTTGAAIDLMLADSEGREIDLTSPFDPFDPHSASFDAPGLSDAARRHRDIMAEALTSVGLTNYPSEYWHWSYGDQGWAYRGRHAHAIYGSIQPQCYTPPAEDDIDLPLERIDS
jgi:D-alanyl-D-alanine dipeptidase